MKIQGTHVGLCMAFALPLAACSAPVPVPSSQAGLRAYTGEDSHAGTVCSTLLENDVDLPMPASGPDFPESALEVFRVESVPGVQYASKPAVLDGAPGEVAIQLAYAMEDDEGFTLTVCFKVPGTGTAYARTGPIRSQAREHPVVTEAFVANSDGDPAPELVLLVSWAVSNALETSGRLYEPYAFDFPGDVGPVPRLSLEDQGLESGLDGVLEGETVEYPYKTEEAIRARLRQTGQNLQQ